MDLEKDADRFTMQRQVSGIQLDPVINQNREKERGKKRGRGRADGEFSC